MELNHPPPKVEEQKLLVLSLGSLEFDQQNLIHSEENNCDKYKIFDTSMYEEDEPDFNSGSCQFEVKINSSIGNSSGSRIFFDISNEQKMDKIDYDKNLDADQESVQVSPRESYDKFSKRKEVVA